MVILRSNRHHDGGGSSYFDNIHFSKQQEQGKTIPCYGLVIFPVSREFTLETGSLETPSTANKSNLFIINNLTRYKTPELAANSGVLFFSRESLTSLRVLEMHACLSIQR